MTINSRTLWTSLVIVLVMAVAIVSLAAQPPGGNRGGRQPGMEPGALGLLRGLDLTDSQREQIRAIVEEQRTGENPMRKRGELQRELHAAIFADTPDHAKIEQLKLAIAEADAAALSARIEHQLKIAQILTPEQRVKAREMPAPGPRGRGARR